MKLGFILFLLPPKGFGTTAVLSILPLLLLPAFLLIVLVSFFCAEMVNHPHWVAIFSVFLWHFTTQNQIDE